MRTILLPLLVRNFVLFAGFSISQALVHSATINAEWSPLEGGTVLGAGTYPENTIVPFTVQATNGWYISNVRMAEGPLENLIKEFISYGLIAGTRPPLERLQGTVKASAETKTAIVTFTPKIPIFTKQPEMRLIDERSGYFSAEVIGSLPLSLQWFKNGVAVPEATRNEVVITDLVPGEAAVFSVQASNAFGVTISSNAVLSFAPDPAKAPQIISMTFFVAGIETNATAVTVPEGTLMSVMATFQGIFPIKYKWFKNGIPINQSFENPGVTGLSFFNLSYTNGGQYTVQISNPFGTNEASAEIIVLGRISAYSPMPFKPRAQITNDTISFATTLTVELDSNLPSPVIFYTLDGSAPSFSSDVYTGPITISQSGTLRATAYTADLLKSAELHPIVFTKGTPLTIQTFDTAEGYVWLSSAGPYASGETLHIEAIAWPTFQFSRFFAWAGSITNTNAVLDLTLQDNLVLYPIFGAEVRALPLGNGTIRGATSSTSVPLGSTLKLDAIPNNGFSFVRWGGNASGINSHLVVTNVSTNLLVTALFEALPAASVSVTALAEGEGAVSVSPAGNRIASGSSVTLTATSDNGQQFLGWNGAVQGNENPLSLTLNSNATITARFTTNIILRSDSLLPQGFRISATGVAGTSYQFENSTDLQMWSKPFNVPPLPGSFSVVLPFMATNPPTFIRIRKN